MIFVTLGTQDKPFIRLLQKIDELINNETIIEKVIVQAGCSDYQSNNMEIINYLEAKDFKKIIKNADIIITHGGVGTILDGLKHSKKIIAIPREAKYNEAINDHQKQICNELSNQGYILTGPLDNLGKLLIEVKNFVPKKYNFNNVKFNKYIESIIDYEI